MSPADLEQYTRLVHQMAWRYARRLPRWTLLSEQDLAQEGWVTLTRALRSFVPGKARFTTYATVTLARRYAEILRLEHRRVETCGPAAMATMASPPSQALVEARVDLARGQWDGPPLTKRRLEEATARLKVLA